MVCGRLSGSEVVEEVWQRFHEEEFCFLCLEVFRLVEDSEEAAGICLSQRPLKQCSNSYWRTAAAEIRSFYTRNDSPLFEDLVPFSAYEEKLTRQISVAMPGVTSRFFR